MNAGVKRLGLNKFKMISQDKDSTTFQHPAGHSITVAHNSLSKDLKTQLLGLSKAGQDEKTRMQSEEEKNNKGKMADGGEVSDQDSYEKESANQASREKQRRDAGASDATGPLVSPTMEKGLQKKYPTQVPINEAKGGAIKKYAAGTPDKPIGNEDQAVVDPAPVGTPDPNQPMFDIPAEQKTEEYQQAQLHDPATQQMLQEPQNQQIMQEHGMAPAPDTQAQAPAQAQQTSAPASVPEESAQTPQAPAAPAAPSTPEEHAVHTYQHEKNDIQQSMDKFNQDQLMGHIHPKTFNDLMSDKSTMGKIGTIFGMMLAGMGAGLTGQKNAVFEMMQNQIDKDIEAQKSSASNAQNLYKMNKDAVVQQAQANNMNIDTETKATVLTNMQMQANALHNMVKIMNSLPPGPKKDQATQDVAMAQGLVNANYAKLSDLAAGKSAYMNYALGQGQQGAQDNPALSIRRKQVMGLITPQQSEAALNEVKQIENHNQVNKNALNSFDEIAKMQTAGNRIANPIQAQKRIDANWNAVSEQITKDTEGRVTPITMQVMESLKPELTDNDKTTQVKREKFNALLHHGYSTPTLDAIGVPIKKSMPQSQESPEIKTLNGVKYQKVPGGWQKVK